MFAQSNTLSSSGLRGAKGSPSFSAAEEIVELRRQIVGTNINSQTFLATDYLNHFNEIVMLIELTPSMPDCIEDIGSWHPKSYEEHFTESGFSDKELAIAAYQHAPDLVKKRFDETVAELDRSIIDAIESLKETLEMDIPEYLSLLCEKLTAELRHLIDTASAIINGHHETLKVVAHTTTITTENDSIEKTQAAVDELFGD